MRASQIDVDEDTDASRWRGNCWRGSDEDETAWRSGQWYTARLRPAPLRPDERRTATANHRQRRYAPGDPHSR